MGGYTPIFSQAAIKDTLIADKDAAVTYLPISPPSRRRFLNNERTPGYRLFLSIELQELPRRRRESRQRVRNPIPSGQSVQLGRVYKSTGSSHTCRGSVVTQPQAPRPLLYSLYLSSYF